MSPQLSSRPADSPTPRTEAPPRRGRSAPATAEALFSALAASPRPALIRYASGGERIELSGRVLENWIAKTANLWTEELDAVPGDTVRLPDEVHWRTVALGLAAVRAGLRLVDAEPTFWTGFEDCPAAHDAEVALFVARPGLASRWSGDASGWPAGAVDYVAEVRAFDDVFRPVDPLAHETVVGGPDGEMTVRNWVELVAATAAERTVPEPAPATPSAEEFDAAAGQDTASPGRAVLLAPAAQDAEGLAGMLGLMLADRAVVLVDEETRADDAALSRILDQERAVRG